MADEQSTEPEVINPPPKGKPWLGMVGTSAIAIACIFTSSNEGTRHTAYPDPATRGAPWTICDGHTEGVHKGDTATDAQCAAYLKQDMAVATQSVARCIRVPINVNMAAALYDTVFNAGDRVVCGSTVQARANANDLIGMCYGLKAWKFANGVVYQPLIKRRANAVQLCLWPTTNPQLVYPANWKPSS
jgi:lysozyme